MLPCYGNVYLLWGYFSCVAETKFSTFIIYMLRDIFYPLIFYRIYLLLNCMGQLFEEKFLNLLYNSWWSFFIIEGFSNQNSVFHEAFSLMKVPRKWFTKLLWTGSHDIKNHVLVPNSWRKKIWKYRTKRGLFSGQ